MIKILFFLLSLSIISFAQARCENIVLNVGNEVACTASVCGQYPILTTDVGTRQVGCTDISCRYYFVPQNFTLACWSTGCDVFPAFVSSDGVRQIACTQYRQSCHYEFVPYGYHLNCTNSRCWPERTYVRRGNPNILQKQVCTR